MYDVAIFINPALSNSLLIRGYSWKTVIGHNNAQLNAVVRRGISENHFHLNGAAPIFQISWLSLMNNVNVSQLGEFLRSYDKNRMYTNIAYFNYLFTFNQAFSRIFFYHIFKQPI